MRTAGTVAAAAAILGLGAGVAMADTVKVSGTVTDTFGQRYVVDEGGKKSLVDLGPEGTSAVTIKTGDKIIVDGELTDAGEVHAFSVAVGSAAPVELPGPRSLWQKLTGAKGEPEGPFGPVEAKAEVTKAGYETVGEPTPEKRHFEILAKKDGKFFEVHAHRNGDVKVIRTVDASDPRWGSLVK